MITRSSNSIRANHPLPSIVSELYGNILDLVVYESIVDDKGTLKIEIESSLGI